MVICWSAGVGLPFVQYVASLAIVQAVQGLARERLQVSVTPCTPACTRVSASLRFCHVTGIESLEQAFKSTWLQHHILAPKLSGRPI